jgi:uncharacterized protein YbcI
MPTWLNPLWVLNHVGFLFSNDAGRHEGTEMSAMLKTTQTMAEQIAQAATVSQQKRTGHQPKSVSVVLSGDTLVVTLHGALSPAEQALARSPEGAAKVQEFHRQLFNNAADTLRLEIKRITGMDVREATAQVEPRTGAVVQVFTSGTMVQVFLLSGKVPDGSFDAGEKNTRTEALGVPKR